MRETTALGAAIAAGLALDIWPGIDALGNIGREGRTVFKPRLDKAKGAAMFRLWQRAVGKSSGWVVDEDEFPP